MGQKHVAKMWVIKGFRPNGPSKIRYSFGQTPRNKKDFDPSGILIKFNNNGQPAVPSLKVISALFIFLLSI